MRPAGYAKSSEGVPRHVEQGFFRENPRQREPDMIDRDHAENMGSNRTVTETIRKLRSEEVKDEDFEHPKLYQESLSKFQVGRHWKKMVRRRIQPIKGIHITYTFFDQIFQERITTNKLTRENFSIWNHLYNECVAHCVFSA
ncbi:hypothetical protein Trydic_g12656 [Trypoxylus dichotomus]